MFLHFYHPGTYNYVISERIHSFDSSVDLFPIIPITNLTIFQSIILPRLFSINRFSIFRLKISIILFWSPTPKVCISADNEDLTRGFRYRWQNPSLVFIVRSIPHCHKSYLVFPSYGYWILINSLTNWMYGYIDYQFGGRCTPRYIQLRTVRMSVVPNGN